MKIHSTLVRKDRRLLKKLKHKRGYLVFLSCMYFLFPPVKKFISLPVKGFQKIFGIVSYSVMNVFFLKIGVIDDFIIHKKLRGTGAAYKLFSTAERKLEEERVDCIVLASGKERKASHKFYKKAGMTIITLGFLGVVAYKKVHKK